MQITRTITLGTTQTIAVRSTFASESWVQSACKRLFSSFSACTSSFRAAFSSGRNAKEVRPCHTLCTLT